MHAEILTETEGLTKEMWLTYRRMGIGGSDVAPLLGLSKWKSELELWLDKTGQAEELEGENEAMLWGNIMEPILRSHFEEVTGRKAVEVKAILRHPAYPYMLANVDGITSDEDGNPAILEIKTASEYKRSEWENEVPVYYQTQIQHYLCVTGIKKAYCAVLVGGNSFRLYEVEEDVEVQRMLTALEGEFWDKVRNNIRPEVDGSESARKLLDSLYKGGITGQKDLPDEAVGHIEDYIKASEEEERAKARKQEASNRLKELMGDYEKAKCGKYSISWKPVGTDRLDTKVLKEKEPEIYEKYLKTTVSRRFTVK